MLTGRVVVPLVSFAGVGACPERRKGRKFRPERCLPRASAFVFPFPAFQSFKLAGGPLNAFRMASSAFSSSRLSLRLRELGENR